MENFLDNISSILNVFYSSIKTEGYKFIDNISTITTDIFQKEPLKSIYINKNMNSFSLIISAIVSGIILYYVFKTIISLYSNISVSNVYYLIIKIIIITIISSNSFSICKELININFLFSDTIKSFLEEISEEKIDYSFLEDNISTLEDFFDIANKTGINGLKDSIICIYIFALVVFFSVRYFIINLCVILSPFAFICLISSKTKSYFYCWFKLFVFNLLIQSINYVIIYIPVVSQNEKEIYTPLLIGSIIVMFKINQVIGDIKNYGKN